jgi:putative endonuclease
VRERGGEIDLIMREGSTTVFVEVRYRRSAQFGGAAASVTGANNTNYYRPPACGLRATMGVLILWIAGSMLAFTGNDVEWFKDAFNDRS